MKNNKNNNPIKKLTNIARAFKDFSITINQNSVILTHKDFNIAIDFKNPKVFGWIAKFLISNTQLITDLLRIIEEYKKENRD